MNEPQPTVESLLAEFGHLSDRQIADMCAVRHQLVGSMRPRKDVDESSTPPTRTDSLGRQQPATKPARKPAPMPVASAPDTVQEVPCIFRI